MERWIDTLHIAVWDLSVASSFLDSGQNGINKSDFSDYSRIFAGGDVNDIKIVLLPPREAGKPLSLSVVLLRNLSIFLSLETE